MSIVNQDRPNPQKIGGELRQAIGHGAGPDVVAEYRRRLGTERAERAIRRALDAAPPLRAEQVAYLRAVLHSYGTDEVATDE